MTQYQIICFIICLHGFLDFRLSFINPLLKKALLDIDEKKNYRPVSNLLFMSKLIERVVLNRLDHHMLINNLFCKSQFGYKKYHSTETMMLGLLDGTFEGESEPQNISNIDSNFQEIFFFFVTHTMNLSFYMQKAFQ